ncbi:hypothetical protein B0J17DRAFT_740343 [Rhizoctonia solani]|nr:hypothetical protein B0J17DRAFT_740343 [Rhizoctonia solani]
MQLRRRECAPGTRTGVQDRIKAWVNDPAGPKVLWMNGLPGMGKTTISYSLCKWLYDEHLLGASYFCSRTPSVCGSLERLIPTIAHQLAGFLPVFQSSLCKVLEEHPDSNSLEPHLQYERLLLRPLQEAKGQISKDTFIVIDGLDECEDYLSIQIHLEQLLCLPTELRIRLFITSRPEQVIYNSMFAAGYVSTAIQLHNIDESIIKTDIKNYIYKSLEEMSPTPTQIEQLADLSGNSFLYAATAVEYILPHHSGGDPATRLQTILMHSRTGLKSRAAKFYEPLYLLYSTVLEQVVKKHPEGKETEDLQLVLWTVVCAKEPMTVGTLAKLIGFEPNRIKRSLESLHSVLHVPERVGYVTVLHASFSDFIRNTPGPGELGCEETVHSLFMAQRCFAVMRSKLKFNICGLETSFVADGDVLELERRFESSVPAELFYACRYWSYHLQQISLLELKQGDAKGLDKMLSEFLSKRLLFWMEVLNLRGCMEAGVEMLFSTRSWLVVSATPVQTLMNMLTLI